MTPRTHAEWERENTAESFDVLSQVLGQIGAILAAAAAKGPRVDELIAAAQYLADDWANSAYQNAEELRGKVAE